MAYGVHIRAFPKHVLKAGLRFTTAVSFGLGFEFRESGPAIAHGTFLCTWHDAVASSTCSFILQSDYFLGSNQIIIIYSPKHQPAILPYSPKSKYLLLTESLNEALWTSNASNGNLPVAGRGGDGESGTSTNIGALITRIGFGGIVYYVYVKETLF